MESGMYMNKNGDMILRDKYGRESVISDDVPDEMFEDMLHAQVRMQQLAGIKQSREIIEAKFNKHIHTTGPGLTEVPCGTIKYMEKNAPRVKDVKELFPDGTAFAHLDDGRFALIIDPDKMDQHRWQFDQNWGRYVAQLANKERLHSTIKKRTLEIVKGYVNVSLRDMDIMKNSLKQFFYDLCQRQEIAEATVDVFNNGDVRTRYLEFAAVEWIETWFKVEGTKPKPILNLTADTTLSPKDLEEYEINARGYRINIKDSSTIEPKLIAESFKKAIEADKIFSIGKVPWTIVTAEKWKKEGLCPQCGSKGEWVNMAAICKDHGKFMG